MSNALKIAGALGAPAVTYVDDVFSAYTYTGNGATQTITNGIDLAGKGGMVWIKNRTRTTPAQDHVLFDTNRGAYKALRSNGVTSETNFSPYSFTSFGSTGFTVADDGVSYYYTNTNNDSYVSWTFRKAPKFFDVVTYTGNGANRTISHSLGIAPGMIIIKNTGTTSPWTVYHASLANTEYAVLNTTAAKVTGATTYWNSTTATSSVFSLGSAADVNTNGNTYVAYLFAHDTASDGLIQCGSFTTDGSGVIPTVNLGWEPQFMLFKASSAAQDWYMLDASRNWSVSSPTNLKANTSGAEFTWASPYIFPTATGFSGSGNFSASTTYIYLAIRRPNKPPTAGTQVYNAIARTGTGAAATVTGVGFAPDAALYCDRESWWSGNKRIMDRLRGAGQCITTVSTSTEAADTAQITSFQMGGVALGDDINDGSINRVDRIYINWFFRRAPGVFDIVCYTGTGANRTVTHGLGVAPEIVIVKSRSNAQNWIMQHSALNTASGQFMYMNGTNAVATASTMFNNTAATSAAFTVGTDTDTNQNTYTYVAYLFATKAGISKVGSYTGNGSNITLNMGFTTGARFFMCKRTDSTGDWYVWDSTRGIVASTDPHLSLNTGAAEVTTDDSVDPDNSGIIVNQLAATNINVNNATYIYLSFS